MRLTFVKTIFKKFIEFCCIYQYYGNRDRQLYRKEYRREPFR
jgi:hypothetical protein